MALRGTLETFSVPEVLRLLSNTRKTGLLALDGDRGAGNVWLREGSIIDATSDHERSGDIDATLFDLLRFGAGGFVFEPDATPDDPGTDAIDVEAALGRAESLLAEWGDLESVVPSLRVGVRLVRELTAESVTISAEQWRSLAAVGGGTSAAGLGQRLELGELDTCRRIRDLVEASLVEITDDVPDVEAPSGPTEPVEPSTVDDEVDQEGVERSADETPVHDPARSVAERFDGVTSQAPPSEDDADEFLAQLTNVGPEPAAAPEGDEEINRNLLLKFLSSTKN